MTSTASGAGGSGGAAGRAPAADQVRNVVLIGHSGTGKSSLLKTLYGDLALREGEAQVAGFDLQQMDWKKVPYLRRTLGVVFQDFQLLTDRNVNDNLKFVLRATGWKDIRLMDEKIADVLDKVRLEHDGLAADVSTRKYAAPV